MLRGLAPAFRPKRNGNMRHEVPDQLKDDLTLGGRRSRCRKSRLFTTTWGQWRWGHVRPDAPRRGWTTWQATHGRGVATYSRGINPKGPTVSTRSGRPLCKIRGGGAWYVGAGSMSSRMSSSAPIAVTR